MSQNDSQRRAIALCSLINAISHVEDPQSPNQWTVWARGIDNADLAYLVNRLNGFIYHLSDIKGEPSPDTAKLWLDVELLGISLVSPELVLSEARNKHSKLLDFAVEAKRCAEKKIRIRYDLGIFDTPESHSTVVLEPEVPAVSTLHEVVDPSAGVAEILAETRQTREQVQQLGKQIDIMLAFQSHVEEKMQTTLGVLLPLMEMHFAELTNFSERVTEMFNQMRQDSQGLHTRMSSVEAATTAPVFPWAPKASAEMVPKELPAVTPVELEVSVPEAQEDVIMSSAGSIHGSDPNQTPTQRMPLTLTDHSTLEAVATSNIASPTPYYPQVSQESNFSATNVTSPSTYHPKLSQRSNFSATNVTSPSTHRPELSQESEYFATNVTSPSPPPTHSLMSDNPHSVASSDLQPSMYNVDGPSFGAEDDNGDSSMDSDFPELQSSSNKIRTFRR